MTPGKLLMPFLLICHYCSGQIKMTYSMGCIGNTNMATTVSSNVIAIDGKACFTISNGISTYNNYKAGLFLNSCEVAALNNTTANAVTKINLRAFPNPVVSVVTIKPLDLIQTTDVLFISLYSLSGDLLRSVRTNAVLLNDGLKIDMTGLSMGVYVIKLSSKHTTAEFKLIKVD